MLHATQLAAVAGLALVTATTAFAQAPPAPAPTPPAAAPSRPPIETTKVEGTDNVYIFRNGGHQSMFIVTKAGVIDVHCHQGRRDRDRPDRLRPADRRAELRR
jgi:hypothetical protein